MCKKLCIAVGAVLVGLLIISFTSVGAVMKVKWDETQKYLDSKVPPEAKLKQLNGEIDQIDKDIKKNLDKIASMQVECNKLDDQVAKLREQQTKNRDDIVSLKTTLQSDVKSGAPETVRKLESAVNSYEVRKIELRNKEQLLAAKKEAIELAHQRIGQMREQKDELRLTAVKLEARLEQAKLSRVEDPVNMDDSHLKKGQAIADDLDRQLSKAEEKAKLFEQYGYNTEKGNGKLAPKTKTASEILDAANKALEDNKVSD